MFEKPGIYEYSAMNEFERVEPRKLDVSTVRFVSMKTANGLPATFDVTIDSGDLNVRCRDGRLIVVPHTSNDVRIRNEGTIAGMD